MRILPLVAFLASTLAAQVQSPGGEPTVRAILRATDAHALAERLEERGYDVFHGVRSTSLELCLSPAEEAALRAAGLNPEIVEAAQPLATKMPAAEGVPTGYRDLATITADLNAFAATYPNLAMVVDATSVWGPGATVEGRPLYVLKISDGVATDEDEPNILFASGHHAREIVTPEVAMDIATRLLTGYGVDPQVTALVDANEIWIAPTWNPDGYDYVWTTNTMWRKNRNPDPSGAVGTDLNRNYPLGWDASCGGSTSPSSGTYRGLAPASEAETQTMLGFARDRVFTKVMDFHSSGREVLQTYRCTPLTGDLEAFIDGEAALLANLAGYGTREPSADGEHQQWQMAENSSYAFLVETQTTFQPAYSAAVAEAALVWPLVLGFLEREIPVRGHVTDATTGQPITAEIAVLELPWLAGEVRRANARFGSYHLFLPPGTWTLEVTAPGYFSQTHTVMAPVTGTTVLDIGMVAAPPGFEIQAAVGTDLTLGITAIPTDAAFGYLVPSLDVSQPVGSGPLAGLWPDLTSFEFLTSSPAAGSVSHWTWPVASPLFPADPLVVPLASAPLLNGLTVDVLAFVLDAQRSFLAVTDVVRLDL